MLREVKRDHPRRGRLRHPRVRLQDQPNGAGPGQLQGARRHRPAQAVRRRRGRDGHAGGSSPSRPTRPAWWHKYGDVLPDWFGCTWASRRRPPSSGCTRCSSFPGCSRRRTTPARWCGSGSRARHPDEIERRISLRMGRQELLTKPGGPRLWAIVDEAALRRPIGGTEVMRAQLVQLIQATEEPRSHAPGDAASGLAVTPPRPGRSPSCGSRSLTCRTWSISNSSQVLLYLDKRDDVEKYTEVMERLSVESESPERSVDILSGMLEEVMDR